MLKKRGNSYQKPQHKFLMYPCVIYLIIRKRE